MRRVALLVACLLAAGCSTRPSGVLGPIEAAAPAATRVDMLVATTRAPSDDPNVVFTGERGAGVSLSAFTVSIPRSRTAGSARCNGRAGCRPTPSASSPPSR